MIRINNILYFEDKDFKTDYKRYVRIPSKYYYINFNHMSITKHISFEPKREYVLENCKLTRIIYHDYKVSKTENFYNMNKDLRICFQNKHRGFIIKAIYKNKEFVVHKKSEKITINNDYILQPYKKLKTRKDFEIYVLSLIPHFDQIMLDKSAIER